MRPAVSLAAFLFCCVLGSTQVSSINFHHISFADGLHDGSIRSIAQDRFGYIWIASVGALNRYDGKTITKYNNIPGDSTSPYRTQPRSLLLDVDGRFWIGFETGLTEYDYLRGNFKRIAPFSEKFIVGIESISKTQLLVATRSEVFVYNTQTGKAVNISDGQQARYAALTGKRVFQIASTEKQLYLATNRGVVVIDRKTVSASEILLPEIKDQAFTGICADGNRNVWLITVGVPRLVKLNSEHTSATIISASLTAGLQSGEVVLTGIVADNNNCLWIPTSGNGLLQFNQTSTSFTTHRFSAHLSNGPPTNDYRYIFRDRDENIWLGCHVDGVSFFNPRENLFATLLPFQADMQERFSKAGRAFGEDRFGNYWMGNHDGVTRFNTSTGTYDVWRNESKKPRVLRSNIVRTIEVDENFVWIGTAEGVSRYNLATSVMENVDSTKLPYSFYNSINADKSGNVWFCTNDSAGLYWHNKTDGRFYSMQQHPVLKQYAGQTPTSYVLEDKRNRLWISTSRRGVLMYDKRSGGCRRFTASDKPQLDGLLGNQVIDIKEDNSGWVWIASFNGLKGIDSTLTTFRSFSSRERLAGSMISSVAVDSANRIWIGSNGGLSMLHADRKTISVFLASDGLPSVGFPEHAASTTPSGLLAFPTYSGYLLVKPGNYKARQNNFPFYVAGYTVLNKKRTNITEPSAQNNISLTANQNSFTIHLHALNYANPSQTWYAYKLEGFDDEWHVTQDDKVVYTNIPGGSYRFLYKAAATNADWNSVQQQELVVDLANHFYNTRWFQLLVAGLIGLSVFLLYRYRSGQQRQVYTLKEKAQALEKEKAQVTYENLKQQLNPHFLFNSLTSLSSLISTDPKSAGEFLSSLSKTYRYILKSRDTELVALADELQFAQHYVALQLTRFPEGLLVNFNVAADHNHLRIVPVTLQNLIENAIKHNIIDEEMPLSICVVANNGKLTVSNNLQRKKMVETSNKTGLQSLQSLYQYLSEDPVQIVETADRFSVEIPLL